MNHDDQRINVCSLFGNTWLRSEIFNDEKGMMSIIVLEQIHPFNNLFPFADKLTSPFSSLIVDDVGIC